MDAPKEPDDSESAKSISMQGILLGVNSNEAKAVPVLAKIVADPDGRTFVLGLGPKAVKLCIESTCPTHATCIVQIFDITTSRYIAQYPNWPVYMFCELHVTFPIFCVFTIVARPSGNGNCRK